MISVEIHLSELFGFEFDISHFSKTQANEEFWIVDIIPNKKNWGDKIAIFFSNKEQIDKFIKALQELKKMGGKK